MSDTTVTYCTPEDVAETLDLPDPNDEYGYLTFTNVSHPSYDRVCKMIRANEDQIDRRTKRSWRENYVKDQVLSISEYWKDVNGFRFEYYKEGGNFIQLRKDVRTWDPNPRYADTTSKYEVDSTTGYEANKVADFGTHKGLVVSVGSLKTNGKYDIIYKKEIYPGDKLELRNRLNQWVDISKAPESTNPQTGIRPEETHFWFDYQYGKLYIRTNLFQAYGNSVRITYRYGSEEEVPSAINRLCCLLTAVQILNMQFYNIKVGMGGDLGSVRDSMIRTWSEEMGSIWASYQRAGKVHSMLR